MLWICLYILAGVVGLAIVIVLLLLAAIAWALSYDDENESAEAEWIDWPHGDAALLNHPELPRPPAKPMPREPEPMGA